jgi:hypothetical protein
MTYLRGQRWRFAVALLAVAMGVWLTLTPPPGAPTKPSAAATATERSLDRKLPELEWAETSLDSALNAIERGSGVTIKYDVDALRASGIKPSQLTVTARLRDIRARHALETTLRHASPQTRLRHFIADDGTIVLTTPRGDARRVKTRVIYVWERTADATRPPTPEQAAQVKQAEAEFVRLLTETINPESWVSAGGSIGSMSMDKGVLTVCHTPEGLQLISHLLDNLLWYSEADRLRRRIEEDAR